MSSAPCVLAVGGHDSSGGAGVDADRAAIEAAGGRAEILVSAWTVQDETGVRRIDAVDAPTWLHAARASCARGVAAVKFGLLPDLAALEAARALLESLPASLPRVLDPVLASSSGTRFHDARGVAALRRELLPLGLVWTPNLPELAELSAVELAPLERDPERRVEAARRLLAAGAGAVIVKGGHGSEDPVLDLVLEAGGATQRATPHQQKVRRLEHPRHAGPGMRGSGCRFASALATQLALGRALPDAAREAGLYVGRLIAGDSL